MPKGLTLLDALCLLTIDTDKVASRTIDDPHAPKLKIVNDIVKFVAKNPLRVEDIIAYDWQVKER